MNTIKVYLDTSGKIASLDKNFPVYQRQWQNVLLNILVPTEILQPAFEVQHFIGSIERTTSPTDNELNSFVLLQKTYLDKYDTVYWTETINKTYYVCVYNGEEWEWEETEFFLSPTTYGTNVKIGSISVARNGQLVKSKSYAVRYLKNVTVGGIEYALYERKLPSAFTANYGDTTLVINVVNIGEQGIDTILTSQQVILAVLPSSLLDTEEPIEPSIADSLQSQINNLQLKDNEQDVNINTLLEAKTALEIGKQDKYDNSLETEQKTIVGAINELKTAIEAKSEEDRINELDERLTVVENDIGNINEKVDDNTSSITALEVEHTAIREDIEEAQRGVEEVQELIPSTASVDNPLTTESEVIQLVQENRACFRGNYETWQEVPRTITGYPQDPTGSKTPTVNDYIFIRDASTYGADYSGTWRFAYTGMWAELGANGWKPEYEYQSQPFTDEQWAALNSGATAELISSITQKREYVGLTLAYRGGNQVVVSADGETTYTLNSLYTLLQDKTKDVHIVVNVSNDDYIPVYVYSASIIFFSASYSGVNSQCSYIEVSVDNTASVHFITNETTDNKISEITDDDEEDEEKYTSATAVVKYLYPVEDTGDEVYTLEMHPNKTYIIETPIKSLNLEFGDIAEYHIQFITADSGDDTYELPEIAFSREIVWANGERPSFSWGTRYEISILGDCGVYQEFYAEEEE